MVLNKLDFGDYLGLLRTTKNPQDVESCGFLYFFVPGRNIVWAGGAWITNPTNCFLWHCHLTDLTWCYQKCYCSSMRH